MKPKEIKNYEIVIITALDIILSFNLQYIYIAIKVMIFIGCEWLSVVRIILILPGIVLRHIQLLLNTKISLPANLKDITNVWCIGFSRVISDVRIFRHALTCFLRISQSFSNC